MQIDARERAAHIEQVEQGRESGVTAAEQQEINRRRDRLLASIALSGWAMWRYALHLTGSSSGAVLAGIVFAFVVIMALFLWVSDKLLEWALYDLILGWSNK